MEDMFKKAKNYVTGSSDEDDIDKALQTEKIGNFRKALKEHSENEQKLNYKGKKGERLVVKALRHGWYQSRDQELEKSEFNKEAQSRDQELEKSEFKKEAQSRDQELEKSEFYKEAFKLLISNEKVDPFISADNQNCLSLVLEGFDQMSDDFLEPLNLILGRCNTPTNCNKLIFCSSKKFQLFPKRGLQVLLALFEHQEAKHGLNQDQKSHFFRKNLEFWSRNCAHLCQDFLMTVDNLVYRAAELSNKDLLQHISSAHQDIWANQASKAIEAAHEAKIAVSILCGEKGPMSEKMEEALQCLRLEIFHELAKAMVVEVSPEVLDKLFSIQALEQLRSKKDTKGETPLEVAIKAKNDDITKRLVDSGVEMGNEIELCISEINLNALNLIAHKNPSLLKKDRKAGQNLLKFACAQNKPEAAKKLVQLWHELLPGEKCISLVGSPLLGLKDRQSGTFASVFDHNDDCMAKQLAQFVLRECHEIQFWMDHAEKKLGKHFLLIATEDQNFEVVQRIIKNKKIYLEPDLLQGTLGIACEKDHDIAIWLLGNSEAKCSPEDLTNILKLANHQKAFVINQIPLKLMKFQDNKQNSALIEQMAENFQWCSSTDPEFLKNHFLEFFSYDDQGLAKKVLACLSRDWKTNNGQKLFEKLISKKCFKSAETLLRDKDILACELPKTWSAWWISSKKSCPGIIEVLLVLKKKGNGGLSNEDTWKTIIDGETSLIEDFLKESPNMAIDFDKSNAFLYAVASRKTDAAKGLVDKLSNHHLSQVDEHGYSCFFYFAADPAATSLFVQVLKKFESAKDKLRELSIDEVASAIKENNSEFLQLCKDNFGWKPEDFIGPDGNSAMHLACHAKSRQVLSWLTGGLGDHSQKNVQNDSGDTWLHLAAPWISLEEMEPILAKVENEYALISTQNRMGKNALMIALKQSKHHRVVEYLFERSYLDQKDAESNNVFHYALNFRSDLVSQKAKDLAFLVNEQNRQGLTPLMLAIEKRNEIAGKFLSKDLNIRLSDSGGNSYLHKAVENNFYVDDLIEVCRSCGSFCLALQPNSKGELPYQLARSSKVKEKLLQHNGISQMAKMLPEESEKFVINNFEFILSLDAEEVMVAALDRVSASTKEKEGGKWLGMATEGNKVESLKPLIQDTTVPFGVDTYNEVMTKEPFKNSTKLCLAALQRKFGLPLNDLDHQDDKGNTALHYALQENLVNVGLLLLEESNERIFARNKQGNNPLLFIVDLQEPVWRFVVEKVPMVLKEKNDEDNTLLHLMALQNCSLPDWLLGSNEIDSTSEVTLEKEDDDSSEVSLPDWLFGANDTSFSGEGNQEPIGNELKQDVPRLDELFDINAKSKRDCTPLALAMISKSIKLANQLIDQNAELVKLDERLSSACHLILEQHLGTSLLKSVLGKDKDGAIVNSKNLSEDCPLHIAVKLGCQSELEEMLACQSTDILILDGNRNSVLHLAIENNHSLIDSLMEAQEKQQLLSLTNSNGLTALHMAIEKGPSIFEKLLCQVQCNGTCFLSEGRIPDDLLLTQLLLKLKESKYKEGIDHLLKHSSECFLKQMLKALEHADIKSNLENGSNLLHFLLKHWCKDSKANLIYAATVSSSTKILKEIFRTGNEAKDTIDTGIATATQYAAEKMLLKPLELLSENGYAYDAFQKSLENNPEGFGRIFHELARGGHAKLFRWAIGTNPSWLKAKLEEELKEPRETLLHSVALGGNLEIYHLLKEALVVDRQNLIRQSLNHLDEDGNAVLHRAATNISDEKCEMITDFFLLGADPSTKNNNQQTFLQQSINVPDRLCGFIRNMDKSWFTALQSNSVLMEKFIDLGDDKIFGTILTMLNECQENDGTEGSLPNESLHPMDSLIEKAWFKQDILEKSFNQILEWEAKYHKNDLEAIKTCCRKDGKEDLRFPIYQKMEKMIAKQLTISYYLEHLMEGFFLFLLILKVIDYGTDLAMTTDYFKNWGELLNDYPNRTFCAKNLATACVFYRMDPLVLGLTAVSVLILTQLGYFFPILRKEESAHYKAVFNGQCCEKNPKQKLIVWIFLVILQPISSFVYGFWMKKFVDYWRPKLKKPSMLPKNESECQICKSCPTCKSSSDAARTICVFCSENASDNKGGLERLEKNANIVNNETKKMIAITENSLMPLIQLALLFPSILLYFPKEPINTSHITYITKGVATNWRFIVTIASVILSLLSMGISMTEMYFIKPGKFTFKTRKIWSAYFSSIMFQVVAKIFAYQSFAFGTFYKNPNLIIPSLVIVPLIFAFFRGFAYFAYFALLGKPSEMPKITDCIIFGLSTIYVNANFQNTGKQSNRLVFIVVDVFLLCETLFFASFGASYILDVNFNKLLFIGVVTILHLFGLLLKALYYLYIHPWGGLSDKKLHETFKKIFWLLVALVFAIVLIMIFGYCSSEIRAFMTGIIIIVATSVFMFINAKWDLLKVLKEKLFLLKPSYPMSQWLRQRIRPPHAVHTSSSDEPLLIYT